jgi:signal transduction histidine kinase
MSTVSHATAHNGLARRYAADLQAYLSGAGEAALARAYALGREAAAIGVGVVELAIMHSEVLTYLTRVVGVPPSPLLANQFFAEALSPFEMIHRGFREANARLEGLLGELRQRNQELERAKDAVEAANHELEAFSYSVSHDLRTPLRGIDGFSQVLLERYAEHLPDRGLDYLRRVRAAAQRKGDLIDA